MLKKFDQQKNIFGKLKQIIATICLGPMIIGMSISWTSPVLPQLESNSSVFHLTNSEASWVGSTLGVGVVTSAVPIGYLASHFGIKKCAMGLVIPLLLFIIITVTSSDVYTLCLARFFCGVVNGGVSVIGPMYMSEISDPAFRGTLGSTFEFLIYVGVVFVATCGAYVNYIALTIAVGTICLCLSSMFLFLPESPTHLMKNNKMEEAKEVIKFYRGEFCNVNEVLADIQNVLETKHQQLSLRQALRSKAVIKGLIASVGLTLFQKFCGNDCILLYTVNIFQTSDTGINAYTSSILVAFSQFTSAVLIVFVVEYANRRFFLYVSTIGMALSLAMLATYFQLKESNCNFVGFQYIPLASLILFAFAFNFGLGPIIWMINGELFAPTVKGLANGIIITTNWGFIFLVTKSFPLMMTNMGPQFTFYLFSLCMFACAIFVRFFVPETRGKSLEQIQIELSS